jgi:endonuclease/exonuclease/phosphatase family metal-dependent hydrolase
VARPGHHPGGAARVPVDEKTGVRAAPSLRSLPQIAAALLLAFGAACARPSPQITPAPEAVVLTVVTWNMRTGTGDLAALIQDLESGRLTGTRGADYVLLLQEATAVVERRATAASTRAKVFSYFVPVRRFPDRTIGNAIVSTIPLDNTRTISLPRERQPRAAAAAEIEVAGETMFVVSVHLENRLGWLRGLFGDAARQRQTAALLAALTPASAGIVGGDMNTMLGPNEPALRLMLERFDDTPPEPLAPTFRERLVLDHLFFDLPEGWSAVRRVLPQTYGSDHRPVLGVITRPHALQRTEVREERTETQFTSATRRHGECTAHSAILATPNSQLPSVAV